MREPEEYLSDFLYDAAMDMSIICYGKNPSEEQLEECIECLRDKWGI